MCLITVNTANTYWRAHTTQLMKIWNLNIVFFPPLKSGSLLTFQNKKVKHNNLEVNESKELSFSFFFCLVFLETGEGKKRLKDEKMERLKERKEKNQNLKGECRKGRRWWWRKEWDRQSQEKEEEEKWKGGGLRGKRGKHRKKTKWNRGTKTVGERKKWNEFWTCSEPLCLTNLSYYLLRLDSF